MSSERHHQTKLIEWAGYKEAEHPELKLLHAVPNGGHRHAAVGGKLKAEGVKAGVPDLHLPAARAGYIGLWIEMKYGRNTPTKAQARWMRRLAEAGHYVSVCRTWHEAADLIEAYLRGQPGEKDLWIDRQRNTNAEAAT